MVGVMGRPKGSINEASTSAIRQRIFAAAARLKKGDVDGIDQVIESTFERALGVLVEKETEEGPKVYAIPPDVNAAKVILEQGFGKPRESVEVTDPNEKFKGLPQVILVPPPSWGKKKKGA